jgi:hypothetical protein
MAASCHGCEFCHLWKELETPTYSAQGFDSTPLPGMCQDSLDELESAAFELLGHWPHRVVVFRTQNA